MKTLPVLAGFTLRALLAGRRAVIPGLLALLPAAIASALLWVGSRFDIRTLSADALYRVLATDYFHLFLILAAILFGTSAIGDDAEDGSVLYLLVRPIRRGQVYLGKVAAAVLATLAAVLPALLVTFAILALGGERAPRLSLLFRDLGWLAAGGVAYPAAFAAAAAIGRRPLQFAVVYLLLWEFPLAFAPTSLRFLTVSHYVLALMPQASWWNSVVSTFGMNTPVPAASIGLAAVTTALLALGALRFERKEHLAPPAA